MATAPENSEQFDATQFADAFVDDLKPDSPRVVWKCAEIVPEPEGPEEKYSTLGLSEESFLQYMDLLDDPEQKKQLAHEGRNNTE